jgi:hypothetical protein
MGASRSPAALVTIGANSKDKTVPKNSLLPGPATKNPLNKTTADATEEAKVIHQGRTE